MQNSHDAPGLFPRDEPRPSGWVTAYCDGGSRGNPGPAGYGVHITDENGIVVGQLSEFLGRKTNNYAEYSGLLAALDFAVEREHPRLRVVSDSELMVKQIKGQYRVNSPELRPLYEEARRRINKLESFQIQHVLREKNQQADRLANLAMDRGMGKAAPVATTPTLRPAGTRLADRAAAATRPGADASRTGPPIPIVYAPGTSETAASTADASSITTQPRPVDRSRPVRGFVKGGVIHFLEGELPDGVFVRITPEPQDFGS
jgi:ribonuclease HI